MSRFAWVWIGVAAMAAVLLPNAVAAAGAVSFATPAGLASLPPLNAVTCPSATACVAVGGAAAGAVVSTTDGGRHWSAIDVPGITAFGGVACLDATHCVAVGSAGGSGAIAITLDGRSWGSAASVPSATPLSSVSCTGPSRCMAVGSTYTSSSQSWSASTLVSSDQGATWAASAIPTYHGTPTTLNAVDCPTTQRCFAVGGNAWVSNDFGSSWQDITPPDGCSAGKGFCMPTYSDLTGVDFTNASHGVVVGGEQCGGQGATKCPSVYFSTSNGGAGWTMWPSSNNSRPFLLAVRCSATLCLAASDAFSSSSILLSSDGASWASVGSTAGTVNSIACAPGGPCVAVGTTGSSGLLLVSQTGIRPAAGRSVSNPVSGRGGAGGNAGGAASSVVSSFSTSLPTPAAVVGSRSTALLSALVVLALVLLVVFPSQLFNRTYEANHERIRDWWERRIPWTQSKRERAEARALHGAAGLALAVVVGALLGTLLDPADGFNARSAALFVGIVFSFAFSLGLGTSVNAGYRRARKRAISWRPHALPSGLLVAGACVLVSRLVHFQPGYLYGIIGGIAFAGALPRREEGHLVALTSLLTLVVAAVAWLVWVPVAGVAARPGAGFGIAVLANVLSALFVGGLAGVVLGLVPLHFLPGEKLAGWHWGAWTAIFALAMFGLVQIMLRPQSSTAHVATVPLWTTVGLFLAFGALSVAFWGYFRATAEREAATPAPSPKA